MKEKLLHSAQGDFNKHDQAIHYLGLLIWPFGVMLDAFRHWEKPWSKNIFWFFCIFFGYNFIIARNEINAPDSVRIAQLLVKYANRDMSLNELWRSFYSESSNMVDIVQPLLIFFISRLTENPRILFTIFALVFGYFYSRNIWYVLDHVKSKVTFQLFVYVLTFALINPIWNINGFRMYAAAQIFLFGALPYLVEGKSKHLIWSCISVLFHFSFIVPLVVLLLFILLKNRISLYFVFFIVTAFIKEIDLQQVRSFLYILPPVFQTRVEGYTNIDYARNLSYDYQTLRWFLPLASKSITWITYALVLVIFIYGRKLLKERTDLKALFCFSLLFYGFANILSLIPSGHRFLYVAYSFIFPFFVLLFSGTIKIKSIQLIKGLSMPFLLFFCLVAVRLGMEYFGIMTLLGNPVFSTIISDETNIIEGIKGLLKGAN